MIKFLLKVSLRVGNDENFCGELRNNTAVAFFISSNHSNSNIELISILINKRCCFFNTVHFLISPISLFIYNQWSIISFQFQIISCLQSILEDMTEYLQVVINIVWNIGDEEQCGEVQRLEVMNDNILNSGNCNRNNSDQNLIALLESNVFCVFNVISGSSKILRFSAAYNIYGLGASKLFQL